MGFFLDFDEYLPFKSRAEFEQHLVQHANDPVICMHWYNLIPKSYDSHFHMNRDYWVAPNASPHSKIAFQPKRLSEYSNIVVEQGNHRLSAGPDHTHIEAKVSVGLFHIPIDTVEQLKQKVEIGLEAYKNHYLGQKTTLGSHWLKMREIIESKDVTDRLLNSFIAHYGENDKIADLVKNDEMLWDVGQLEAHGYRSISLDLAGHSRIVPNDTPDMVIVDAMRSIDLFPGGLIVISGEEEQEEIQENYRSEGSFKISKLSDCNELLVDTNHDITMKDFMKNSYHKIETMTATAWGGHIPFMFSLISCLRPRRYVELGSHCGASFYAACQMFKHHNMPSLGIAIDLWEGDSQAGYYGEEVYNNFEYLRTQRYKEQSRSIRSLFADAAEHFEDHSIDLIHIDGLHTYEAVKEDYETWRPKLTENGVIILHDTNEYESTFGVWDFFNDVRNQATASFEFKHTHGLGVLAFGNRKANPMINIIEMMNEDPVNTEHHYARMGLLSVTEALYDLSIANNTTRPKQQATDNATYLDGIGLGSKAMAKVLLKRIKAKARHVIKNRIRL